MNREEIQHAYRHGYMTSNERDLALLDIAKTVVGINRDRSVLIINKGNQRAYPYKVSRASRYRLQTLAQKRNADHVFVGDSQYYLFF